MTNKGFSAGGGEPWDVDRLANYHRMAAAGADRVRADISWAYLQPEEGVWDWDLYDPVVTDARRAGLRYLAILHTTPGWANDDAGVYAPPSDPAAMTEYAYQVGRRYIRRGVTQYQIGNEVNLPHPGLTLPPTGAAYVNDLFLPCLTGLRRASLETHTPVTVVLGSLAPYDGDPTATDPVAFLRDVYATGVGPLFQAVSYHPYTDEPLVNRNFADTPAALDAVSVELLGRSRRIWATEYGAPTGGDYSVSEQRQSALVVEAFDRWRAFPFAGPLFWYCDRDSGAPDSPDREDHFGLLRADGSVKPAYGAFAAQ